MSELDLDELERLAKSATPGPWRCDWFAVFKQRFLSRQHILTTERIADTDYVTAACNALPALIQRVRELERQRDWLAKEVCDSFSPQEWINRAEQAAKEAEE